MGKKVKRREEKEVKRKEEEVKRREGGKEVKIGEEREKKKKIYLNLRNERKNIREQRKEEQIEARTYSRESSTSFLKLLLSPLSSE